MGYYVESAVEPAKESETIAMLKEQIKVLNQRVAKKVDDIADL